MVNILVTGVGGGGHGEQIVKALKMSTKKYQIFGADCDKKALDPNLFSKSFVLPKATNSNYLDQLGEILIKNKIDVLFHGSEPELLKIAEVADVFRDMGVFTPVNKLRNLQKCMNKLELNRILESFGFQPPKTVMLDSLETISEIDFYPVVVKPMKDSGGSNNVFLAQTEDQLTNLIKYLQSIVLREAFIIQEYVGSKLDEYTVGVLFDGKGEYINSIALRRNLSSQLSVKIRTPNLLVHREDLGSELVVSSGISQGDIKDYEEIREFSKSVAQRLGLIYSINIQCRKTSSGVKIFEINPRFSGTTSIRALFGYNEPDVLVRKEVLNENIQIEFPYEQGTAIRSLVEKKMD